jgi:DNA-binding protein HU-beta
MIRFRSNGKAILAVAIKPSVSSKKPGNTVTARQLAEQIAESHELPRKTAHAILADTVALMTRHLRKGDKVRVSGLGILPGQETCGENGS